MKLLPYDEALVCSDAEAVERAVQHPTFHGLRLFLAGGKQHANGAAIAPRRTASVTLCVSRAGLRNHLLEAALAERGRAPGATQVHVAEDQNQSGKRNARGDNHPGFPAGKIKA